MASIGDQPRQRALRNGVFVKRARGFADRARALPGFVPLAAGSAAACVLAVLVGAFNTGELPLPVRIGFWATLMGWNWIKWQGWFAATVRRPTDWPRAAAIGSVLLNAPLPLEVALALGLWGLPAPQGLAVIWVQALVVGATLFALMMLVPRRPAPAASPPALRPAGPLARAGVAALTEIAAVTAEDHYCRVHLTDGRTRLVHARFSDALAELAAVPGAQVNRGAWASSAAVTAAARKDRRWRLHLTQGPELTVSATHLPAVRALGWLHRRAG